MQKMAKRRNRVRQKSWKRLSILQASEQIQECEGADNDGQFLKCFHSAAVKHFPNKPEKIWA